MCLFSHRLQQVTQIDNDLKTRASAYNNLKGNLQNLERKNAWVNSWLIIFIRNNVSLKWPKEKRESENSNISEEPSTCHWVTATLFCATRGSLLTRSLADIVKKEHFVLNSEYLVTLLVVVPKWVFLSRDISHVLFLCVIMIKSIWNLLSFTLNLHIFEKQVCFFWILKNPPPPPLQHFETFN